jgi:hypothetical protein
LRGGGSGRRLIRDTDHVIDETGNRPRRRKSGPVIAAAVIRLPWSNGQAEGQINRLKTIKPAMFAEQGRNFSARG